MNKGEKHFQVSDQSEETKKHGKTLNGRGYDNKESSLFRTKQQRSTKESVILTAASKRVCSIERNKQVVVS